MKAVYNPRYQSATLELAYINANGKRVRIPFPLRFDEKDREKALEAHAKGNIMCLIDLSIPPIITVDDSIEIDA